MADTAITARVPRGRGFQNLQDFSNGAITTGTAKREWIVNFHGRIVDVICDSEAAGSGGSSDIIDVNINGTTIYTTQANRPTLNSGDTGMFSEASLPEVVTVVPGDIISYDVDQVCAGAGSTRFKILISIVER